MSTPVREPASTAPWRQTVPMDQLHPGKYNPREDPGDLDELATLIRLHGLKQPILVAPRPGDDGWDIEDGWRRYLAVREKLQWTEIPAIIIPYQREENRSVRSIYTALITDSGNKPLNQIERAKGFQWLKDEFGFSASEIARQIGMSVSTVTTSLMLLELAPVTQRMIINKEISAAEAQTLLKQYRAKNRKKQGKPAIGPVWEPPWFTATHPLAKPAQFLCDSRDHNMRRRYGAAKTGPYRGACGECWQDVIKSDHEKVLLSAGWTPPPSRANLH